MSVLNPGPCQTLAGLALQSERAQSDGEFRLAVERVLSQADLYDAAPALLEFAQWALNYAREDNDPLAVKARAVIALAQGGTNG